MVSYYLTVFIKIFFNLLWFAIVVRVLLSLFQVGRHNAFVSFIQDITDPLLNAIKKYVPPIGIFDISPIIAMFGIQIVESILLYFVQLMNV